MRRTAPAIAALIAITACANLAVALAGTDPEWTYTGTNTWTASNWNVDEVPWVGATAIFGRRGGGEQNVHWANSGEGLWQADLSILRLNNGADPIFMGQGFVSKVPTLVTDILTIQGNAVPAITQDVWLSTAHVDVDSGTLDLSGNCVLTVHTTGIVIADGIVQASNNANITVSATTSDVLMIGGQGGNSTYAEFSLNGNATASIEGDVHLGALNNDYSVLDIAGGQYAVSGNVNATSVGGGAVVVLLNGGTFQAGSMNVDAEFLRGDAATAILYIDSNANATVTGDVVLGSKTGYRGMMQVGQGNRGGLNPHLTVEGTLWIGHPGLGEAAIVNGAVEVGALVGGVLATGGGELTVYQDSHLAVQQHATLGLLSPLTLTLDGGSMSVGTTMLLSNQAQCTLTDGADLTVDALTVLSTDALVLEDGTCTVEGAMVTGPGTLTIGGGDGDATLYLHGDSTISCTLQLGPGIQGKGGGASVIIDQGAMIELARSPVIGSTTTTGFLGIAAGSTLDIDPAEPVTIGPSSSITMVGSTLTSGDIVELTDSGIPVIQLLGESTLEAEGRISLPTGLLYANDSEITATSDITTGYLYLLTSRLEAGGDCTLGTGLLGGGPAGVEVVIDQPGANEIVIPAISADTFTMTSPMSVAVNWTDIVGAIGERWTLVWASDGFALDLTDISFSNDIQGGLEITPIIQGTALMLDIRARVLGDCNADELVNEIDLLQLVVSWGDCSTTDANQIRCAEDLDENDVIDVKDLLIQLQNWAP